MLPFKSRPFAHVPRRVLPVHLPDDMAVGPVDEVDGVTVTGGDQIIAVSVLVDGVDVLDPSARENHGPSRLTKYQSQCQFPGIVPARDNLLMGHPSARQRETGHRAISHRL